MQPEYQLQQQGLGAIPLIDHFIHRIGLLELLETTFKNRRYSEAILLLLKNIMIERHALYAVREWASWFDPSLVYGGKIGDDTTARALDRLFAIDRASLLTSIIINIANAYELDLSEIHQDTTSVKLSGTYINQHRKAIQLKHGHSKDHRPDLKQLIYALSVTRDGAIPIHFKAYDGNRTDDTLHWETWQTLRGILRRSDFLYVADSKLCVEKTLINIDRNQGKFITVLPRTRNEVSDFNDKLLMSDVRWQRIHTKRSTRNKKIIDVYDLAEGLHQTREGFRLYWFRSSEKRKRDHDNREEKILAALNALHELSESPRNKKAKRVEKEAEKILERYQAQSWLDVKITLEHVDKFKQKFRGRATKHTLYRKVTGEVPRLIYHRNISGIARSEVMDGVFPLISNTKLEAKEILKSYKYQPTLEKRHSLLKSILHVSPVFLKKNDRIEALMFVYFMAQAIGALIERQIKQAMVKHGKQTIQILPEERPSKQPTTEQILRIFQYQARRLLYLGKEHLQTFTEKLSRVQEEVLQLLEIPIKIYS
jgi:transposase